jgi:prepilin-type N-terminal cleavage/methylation domain-containing protein
MFKHLRDAQARRKGEEVVESGFTLIELLVVIVVLGILAATVVFALSGVTGQSAVAACNSDAKTIDVAVQAYINSPDNTTNAVPASVAALVSAPFNNPNGNPDTFLANQSNNKAYSVELNSQLATPLAGVPADAVVVATPQGGTNWAQYDTTGTNPCAAAS